MTDMKRLSPKETAPLLRKALRAAFPGTKFSVRLGRGTAWGNANVFWSGGPTQDEVHEVADPFQGKTFDGLDDSTHFLKTEVETAEGVAESGLGYVLLHRSRRDD